MVTDIVSHNDDNILCLVKCRSCRCRLSRYKKEKAAVVTGGQQRLDIYQNPNQTEAMSDKATGRIESTNTRYSVHDDWNARIQELLDYRMRFGTFTIPTKDATPHQYVDLYKWISHLKQHDEQLSPDQVKQLINIGFFGKQAGTWELNFAKLCAYKERFGDCKLSNATEIMDGMTGFES